MEGGGGVKNVKKEGCVSRWRLHACVVGQGKKVGVSEASNNALLRW